MKCKGIFICICLISMRLLSGCVVFPDAGIPAVSTKETVKVELFAKDYLGKDKAQVEALLGGFVQEEYYNGGLIYQFAGSDMWFWFGVDSATYAEVPTDAVCCFIIAPLAEAADFSRETLSGGELSEKLGFDFKEPVYNELDCMYNYSAAENGVSCLVSCSEDGTVSVKDDFVTYSLVK